MPDDYRRFPRPDVPYYEDRHTYLSQGDIFREVPWSQLGPSLVTIDPTPEGLPVPAGHLPVLQYLWTSHYGIVVSDTCDFRHPKASEIDGDPVGYRHPDSIYYSGYIRMAPVIALEEYDQVTHSREVHERIRSFDHFRRLFYLPSHDPGHGLPPMPEAVGALHMTDLLHIDLVRRLPRVAQLTRVARQQLARKLVYFETGYQLQHTVFNPDLE